MKFRVMVVDDSNIIRNRIGRGIPTDKFEIVATASNGQDALEKFKKFEPDIVTMDLTMPNMDGLSCIQNLTAMSNKVNILVVSALSDKATGIRALQYGARGFICKPFTDAQLSTALEKIARNIEETRMLER